MWVNSRGGLNVSKWEEDNCAGDDWIVFTDPVHHRR